MKDVYQVVREPKRSLVHTFVLFLAVSAVSTTTFAALEEVVVTAERKESSLQETPIAVTAMSSEDIERMQIDTMDDVDIGVPGMRIENNVASNTALNVTLRGTSETTAGFAISESKIGLYQNGIYRRLSGGDVALADIERIEVLRGPQATLFGRNTLAGAINVVTRVPGQETYGDVSVSYDKFDTIELKGVIGGGITESLAGSLSLYYKDRSTGPFTNLVTGDDIGEQSYEGAQGNLSWDASDDLNFYLSVYSTSDDNDGSLGTPLNVATEEFLLDTRTVVVAPAVGQPDLTSKSTSDIDGIDLIATWALSDSLTLKSLSHSSSTDTTWAIDFTAGGFGSGTCSGPDCTSGFFRDSVATQSQISQEFQLLGTADRLDWLVGLYYYDEETDQLLQDYFGFGPSAPQTYDLDVTSQAIFGQLTYDLTDELALTVGARYTRDEKTLQGNKANSFFVPTDFFSDPTDSKATGKIGIDYQVNDDMLVYASYTQGFKSGAFDAFAPAERIGNVLEPELVDSYELGFKGDLLDNRLRLNTALFLAQYSDFAVNFNTGELGNNNIGEADVSGLEIEALWLPTDEWTLSLTLIELFSSGWDETGGVAATGIAPGDQVQGVSDRQWTLGSSYDWHLSDLGRLQLNLTARFIDDYFPQAAHQNRTIERIDARYQYDAALRFYSDSGSHQVWLEGSNLTDEKDTQYLLNFSNFLFNNTAMHIPVEPVSWEMGYKYSF